MTPPQLDVLLLESGMAPDEASDLATLLAPLADPAETPRPSADLLALFGEDPRVEQGPGLVARTRRRRRPGRTRGAVAGVVVLAMSGVGATGLSAAANTLPSPWQHEVSDFSRHYLPFDFPEPRTLFPQGRGALGAGVDHARSAGKHRPSENRRAVSDVREGSRSLSDDRDARTKRLSRSGRPRTERAATMSTPVPRGPRSAAASPGAAPVPVVKPALAPQDASGTNDDETGGSWQDSENGSEGPPRTPPRTPPVTPPKAPSKVPPKVPSKVPSKAPAKGPSTPPTKGLEKGQKPDKGHDPVVGGPKGPQKGPSGPSNGPEPDPRDDPVATPGAGGGDQGDGTGESPPGDQPDPENHDGAGQGAGDQWVTSPGNGQADRGVLPEADSTVERIVLEAAGVLGGP